MADAVMHSDGKLNDDGIGKPFAGLDSTRFGPFDWALGVIAVHASHASS